MKQAIIPAAMRAMYDDWRMSPAVQANGMLFLTGVNGAGLDGSVSDDPATQIEIAFGQVEMVLNEAGGSLADVVEMTSYHVGLRDHLDLFKEIWRARVAEPYPAWTALEVSGFATDNVIVELRVIALVPESREGNAI